MKLGELFYDLGFKIVGKEKLDETDQSVARTTISLAKLTVAVNAVNTAMLAMVVAASKGAASLRDFALSTGLSTDQLQRWQQAAARFNISGEQAANVLKRLQDARAGFALGKPENVGVWSLLGVDPTQKDPNKVLSDLHERLKTIKDDAVARNLLDQLGLADMMPILRSSDAEFRKFRESLVLPPAQIQALADFNKSWNALKLTFAGLANQVSAMLVPAFKLLFNVISGIITPIIAFAKWVNSITIIGPIVRTVIGALAIALLALGAALAVVTAALGAAAVAMGLLTVASIIPLSLILPALSAGIGAVIGALWGLTSAAIAALIPFLPIIGTALAIAAAVAGAVLAIQDLWTALNGGDSVIGGLVEDFITTFFDPINSAIEGIKDAWEYMTNFMAKEIQFIKDLIPDWMISLFGGKSGKTEIAGGGSSVERVATQTADAAAGGISNNQNNNVEIHVDGSRDPQTTASAIQKSFKSEVSQAAYQMPAYSY